VDSLLNEINRVASQTVYNNKTVLDGTHTGQLQVGTENGQNITFNVKSIDTDTLGLTGLSSDATTEAANAGTADVADDVLVGAFTPGFTPAVIATTSDDNATYEADGTILAANQTALETAAASTDNGSDGILGLSVLTAADAEAALEKISVAIEQVGGNRAEYGSLANRLEYTVSNLMNVAEFTTSARSRIEDADFAAESARLAKAQVLQQTGTAMLAQANASSQLAIQLIR
jgi:flagellin